MPARAAPAQEASPPAATTADENGVPSASWPQIIEELGLTGMARMLATPVDFSDHVPTAVRAAPEPGQHTEEVLLELGYDWDAIVELKAAGVIP